MADGRASLYHTQLLAGRRCEPGPRLRQKGDGVTTLHIGFSEALDAQNTVAVVDEGELPEYLQVWVWDLYYANVLHTLGEDEASTGLRATLDNWAGSVVGGVFAPEHKLRGEGLLAIDERLTLAGQLPEDTREVYRIEVAPGEGNDWPEIRVDSSVERSPAHTAASVIALAQYFQARNPNFARELPIHILAMRKFYEDERPATAQESLMEAPLYALNKAMKFFQEMGPKGH